MTTKLLETIKKIRPLDTEMMDKVREYQDHLTKPQGSLVQHSLIIKDTTSQNKQNNV